MKIVMYDPYLYKFTTGMVKWWTEHGHEVKVDRYYDPKLVDWADVIWFETCDNNLKSATNPDEALIAEGARDHNTAWRIQDHDLTGKKVIVRPIDIEVWQGQHAGAVWAPVTDCIFLAPHIRDMMMLDDRPKASEMKVHTIPHSVDLDKWAFKEREHGFNVAVVSELWESKGTDIVPQIALKLKQIDSRYNVTWLGRWSEYFWDKEWFLDFVERNQLPIKLIEYTDSVDEFLEDKNYLLHASKKEAFSCASAEAAAKGIKVVMHSFYGYEPLWGDSGFIWDSIDEAVGMITGGLYESQKYHDYLYQKGYVTDIMMEKIMEVING